MSRPIVIDSGSEIYDLVEHLASERFDNLAQHTIIPDAVYVIGRDQFNANLELIRALLDQHEVRIILCNPAEGSSTLRDHVKRINMHEYVYNGQLFLISGGDMGPQWDYLLYENFLPKVLDYEENLAAISSANAATNVDKKYKFLFLNGRVRPHRKYLIERWKHNGLINNALWSCLDSKPATSRYIQLLHNGIDLLKMPGDVRYLPSSYEVTQYRHTPRDSGSSYVKEDLFAGNWGEIYIEPTAYIDTYFSVVTETVFEYQYSFRTEKIWKPIAMGHPWIAVSNVGYYQDLKNLGFRTFSHVIDEHFDLIEVPQDRIEYVAKVVEDLCNQDLAAFSKECYNTCKYNQQLLVELSQSVRREFPNRFIQYLKAHGFIL